MKKKLVSPLLVGSLLTLFSTFSHAEYLGINDLAMKSENTSLAFMNAVKTTNYDLVKQWLDQGYKLSYSNKEWCSISAKSTSKIATPPSPDKYVSTMSIAAGSGQDTLLLLPTECDGVPLVRVAAAFNARYSSDIATYNARIKASKDYAYQEKLYNIYTLLSSHLSEAQYEEYYPVLMNSDAPSSVRQDALEKYLAGYKNREQVLDPNEKPYQDAIIQASKTPYNAGYDQMVFGITNPGYVIMSQLFYDYVSGLKDYVDVYKKHPDGPVFNMASLKNGGVDLSKYNLSDYNEMDLYTLFKINGVSKMIQTLLSSGIYDINSQDSDGNTVFHIIFDKDKYFSRIKYSPLAGSFIRYFLENGANPLLENKEGKTPYLIFEENKNNNSSDSYKGIPAINDAFIQKEFKD